MTTIKQFAAILLLTVLLGCKKEQPADTRFIRDTGVMQTMDMMQTAYIDGLLPTMNPDCDVCPPDGEYAATGIATGGMFSSFTITFSVEGGKVTDLDITVTGLTTGWQWIPGETKVTDENSGVTYGTAKYKLAINEYIQFYALVWDIGLRPPLPGQGKPQVYIAYQWKSLN